MAGDSVRRSLGKGLSQMIAEQFEGSISEASVDAIIPNKRQPRTHFEDEALQELSASIKLHGVLQPLVVRPNGSNEYELIAGERRLRASKLAGLKTVPIIVRTVSNQDSLEIALIENIQREDISPLEAARAYRHLSQDFHLTQEQVAERVGKSRTAVANTLRLLKLPSSIQKGLEEGLLTEGHARALLSLETRDEQLALFDQIVKKGLSVREVEALVKAPEPKQTSKPKEEDANWEALATNISTYFGSPIKLARSGGGKGHLTIEFYSDEDLERILQVIGLQ